MGAHDTLSNNFHPEIWVLGAMDTPLSPSLFLVVSPSLLQPPILTLLHIITPPPQSVSLLERLHQLSAEETNYSDHLKNFHNELELLSQLQNLPPSSDSDPSGTFLETMLKQKDKHTLLPLSHEA
ncbi:hypothetical protein HMI54_010854 [Coelomomyces lativittatus]|nr:hypothetical protein HMI56_004729 [Coelomomyces lativittatus]KAJ1500409.1 hypothetical protein HMI54_010854 [Coelomomyces lativittatus]